MGSRLHLGAAGGAPPKATEVEPQMQDPSFGELGTDQSLAILGYASIDPQPSARDLAARRRLLSGYLYRELRGELPRGGQSWPQKSRNG